MSQERERSPRARNESIHDARLNLVKKSLSYGLYPTWDVYTRESGRPGSIEDTHAFTRLESAVQRDLLKRIRRSTEEVGLDSQTLRDILTEAARQSRNENKPPTVKIHKIAS